MDKTVESFHDCKAHGHANDMSQSGSALAVQCVYGVQQHRLETNERLVRLIRQDSLIRLRLEHKVVVLLSRRAVELCLP